ncbi:MAG: sterol desaturase family protein [Saprospiraceae bacterium]|nr:sterol desaturase family protein [Saprospiraceae bacterium]
MEAYAQALNIAVPIFLLLIVMEELAARWMGMSVNRGLDAVSSLSSGITNVVKDVLGLSIGILSYGWMLEHFAVFSIKATWMVYLLAFVAKDFAGYWTHRWAHEINFLWNRHIVHHSSEEFNLSCALRQSISEIFQLFTFLLLPAAILGIPREVIAVIGPIQLFMQFWYHTRLIGKMGPLEYILVTPSHHRVHHAMNKEYLDKNYSQVFIIWDKLFGTFQAELAQVPPIYGVKRPVHTWNPIVIGWQHFWLLLTDAWLARSWWDKIRLWFMPTGWRPADAAAAHPIGIVEDFDHFEKYDTRPSRALLVWSWVQLFYTLALMFWLFNQIAVIGSPGIFWYGAFLFASVFSYTTLMDKSRWAIMAEGLRTAFGLLLIWGQGWSWFGLGDYWTKAIILFNLLSLFFSIYICISQIRIDGKFAKPSQF